MNEREDRDLVANFLRTADEAIFRELYRRHTPKLYLMALRLSGGAQADSEDAIQETWIRAVSSLRKFRWDSSLSTWLCGILIHCCQEILARRRKEQAHIIDQPQVDDSAFDLEQMIRKLPDGCRAILILHDLEGYTHEEIATKVGIAAGTSKSQLAHARKLLRDQLSKK